MLRNEREEYGEDAQDVIEGLRRLAQQTETPPDLVPTILARGELLLPSRETQRTTWWTLLAGWRPHPLAWGPVVAAAFFIAGVLIPWPGARMPLQDTISEERSLLDAPQLAKETTQALPASPALPPQALRQERWEQTESAPVPSEPFGVSTRQAPRQLSASSHRQVTATLPAELYAQLQQEAQRRRVSLVTIVREAVEAYMQSSKRAD